MRFTIIGLAIIFDGMAATRVILWWQHDPLWLHVAYGCMFVLVNVALIRAIFFARPSTREHDNMQRAIEAALQHAADDLEVYRKEDTQ